MERNQEQPPRRGVIELLLKRRDPGGDEPFEPDGELEEFSGGNHSLEAKEWFPPDPFPRKPD